MSRAAVRRTARAAAFAATLLTVLAAPRHGWSQG